jgi:hypothetical protein
VAVGTDTGRMVLSGADRVLPLLAEWEKTLIVHVLPRTKESSHEAHSARHRQPGRARSQRRGFLLDSLATASGPVFQRKRRSSHER